KPQPVPARGDGQRACARTMDTGIAEKKWTEDPVPTLKDREVGVMFWAGRDTLQEIASLRVRCGQLGIPGDLELNASLACEWKAALEQTQFSIVTVFAAYTGEDYADIPSVQRTVGFIPPETRQQREQRTYDVSDL